VTPANTSDDILGTIGDVLGAIWQSSLTPVAAPAASTTLLCALIGALAVLIRPVWHLTRHAVTITHEGGHALAALLTGRRLQSIRLHSDTSGVTVSSGRANGPGFAFTAFSGYAAPAVVGLGCAWLAGLGYVTATLWILVALLLLMLTRIRNGFGVWSVVVTTALVAGVSWWGDAALRAGAAHVLAWFLLFGAVRPVIELQRLRSRGKAPTSDADQLASATHLPGLCWVVLWLMATLAAAWLGTVWMLEPLGGLEGFIAGVDF